jgi:hypothetical protein
MASITPSALIAEIRGSVGTQTFSRNTYGPYVKLRKSPLYPNTPAQQVVNTRLANATNGWVTLTQAQRNAYMVVAQQYSNMSRVGERYNLNGFTYFIRHYMFYNAILGGGPTSGQEHQTRSTVKIVSINPSAAAFALTVNNKEVITNQYHMIFSTGYRSGSRLSFNKSKARYITAIASANGDSTPAVKALIEAIFGAMNVNVGNNMTIGVKTVNTRTGEAFNPQWQSFTIAA